MKDIEVKIERDRSIDIKRRIGRFIMFRILKYRKRWKHRMIELIVRDQTIDSEIKYGQKILRKE